MRHIWLHRRVDDIYPLPQQLAVMTFYTVCHGYYLFHASRKEYVDAQALGHHVDQVSPGSQSRSWHNQDRRFSFPALYLSMGRHMQTQLAS